MANLRLISILLLSLFVLSYARTAMEAAQAANEVDTMACTKSKSNMMDYCIGYCELESGASCASAVATELADSSDIDRCECMCGPGNDIVTYNNVPCGMDLMRKWSPSGTDGTSSGTDSSSSSCCLSGALLMGLVGFVVIRR
jgi:hypothetical protein